MALCLIAAIAYNADNLPVSITEALGHTTTIAYDDLGRKSSVTDAEGRTTSYEYDAMDRLIKTTGALGNSDLPSEFRARSKVGLQ